MNLFVEMIKFFVYSMCIVLISKYVLVKILRKLGEILNLKPKIVGNIAGIATSIPELLTVSFSAVTGLMTASIYNIISSNAINLIQYSISVMLQKNQKFISNKAIKLDLFIVVLTIIIPIGMTFFNIQNSVIVVPIFILLLLIFNRITNNAHRLYMNQKKEEIIDEKNINKDVKNSKVKKVLTVIIQVILLTLVGIVLYVIGNLLSDVLTNLCIRFNMPEIVIGILLGFITSMPELITFFEAQKFHGNEKEGIVEATSNLLTSNIMNLCIIQSVGILIYNIVR